MQNFATVAMKNFASIAMQNFASLHGIAQLSGIGCCMARLVWVYPLRRKALGRNSLTPALKVLQVNYPRQRRGWVNMRYLFWRHF